MPGVKGMRWGVRRSSSDDSSTARTLKKRRARELSNDEIKKVVNRVNLEKQYKDVNPKGIGKGVKIVAGVLAAGATVNAIIAFNGSPAGMAAKNLVKKTLRRG
jgi:hypothetical protein